MHTDYLNITVPDTDTHTAEAEVRQVLSAIGGVSVLAGQWRVHGTGTYQIKPRQGFSSYSASGQVLSVLREHGLYSTYLSVFGKLPHHVSLMHVAHDVPEDAPPLLDFLYKKVVKGRVGLTRKRLDPKRHVQRIVRPGHDGRSTGTVYLGKRRASVSAKVYDKRQERIEKGCLDPGPLVRYELALGRKVGVTLRDAQYPETVFWHYMREVLSAPPAVPAWESWAQGFATPPRVTLLPAELLKRRVEKSSELEDLAKLAATLGEHGGNYLLSLMRRKVALCMSAQGKVKAEGISSAPS